MSRRLPACAESVLLGDLFLALRPVCFCDVTLDRKAPSALTPRPVSSQPRGSGRLSLLSAHTRAALQ